MPAGPPLAWGFLLFPGFPMACLTSAIEPLRAANEITGRADFAWRLLGESRAPVRASAGVRFEPDLALAEAEAGRLDALMLLAPPDARFAEPRGTPARLRRLGRAGVVLSGVSGGVFLLKRAGALGEHRPSVHWAYEEAWEAEFPDAPRSRHAVECGRGRITVSGAGAVFDLMLRVVGERGGRALVTEVACWFQHSFVRDEDATQARPVARAGGTQDMLPPPVRDAVRLFEAHVQEPLPIAEVARGIGLSERTLERAFKAATGQGPLRFYRRLRLERGRQRVLYSADPVGAIARGVGFASPGDFARHYWHAFGATPAEERRRVAGLRGLAGSVPPEMG
jgi:transcriptional regulator GlxA family with amidase domain